jgi:DNA-binding transcriptional regulator YiaG
MTIPQPGGAMPETKPIVLLAETSLKLAHVLMSFASALEQPQFTTKSQELLPKVLEYAERLQLRRVAIADRCQVSEATVSRWASGRVKPHAIIAGVAIEAVRDLALEKARQYENEANPELGLVEFG